MYIYVQEGVIRTRESKGGTAPPSIHDELDSSCSIVQGPLIEERHDRRASAEAIEVGGP